MFFYINESNFLTTNFERPYLVSLKVSVKRKLSTVKYF